jgi:prepilin-type N-terminal cleavage/methylation domain-containing protein
MKKSGRSCLKPSSEPRYRGFTLIEISIVIVIIGLLAASIIIGKDLIEAAQLRRALSQLSEFNLAMRTFQNKYGDLPGDIPTEKAEELGLFSMAIAQQLPRGSGDGNGYIDGACDATLYVNCPRGEQLVFWKHLSEAGFISNLSGIIDADGRPENINAMDSQTVLTYLPEFRLGSGMTVEIHRYAGNQYFHLNRMVNLLGVGDADYRPALTPMQASAVDIKLDDGMPNNGTVRATSSSPINPPPQINCDYVLGAPENAISYPGAGLPPACWSQLREAGYCIYAGASEIDSSALYAIGNSETENVAACGLLVRTN